MHVFETRFTQGEASMGANRAGVNKRAKERRYRRGMEGKIRAAESAASGTKKASKAKAKPAKGS